MSLINKAQETLHRIRARLYVNHLPGVKGTYIARTDDEASLDIARIAAAARARGGYTGSEEDMAHTVQQFLAESMYQLANGFTLNLHWFSVHPAVSGTFEKAESFDPARHKVSFRFRIRAPLRALAEKIEVLIEGFAPVEGYVNEVVDVSTGVVSETLTPGGMLIILGHKLKVMGDAPECGLYFVPASGAPPVRADGNFAENTAGKLIVLVPPLAGGVYRLRIVSQYTHGGHIRKEPGIIDHKVDLSAAPPRAPSAPSPEASLEDEAPLA